ncbi:MAG: LicD family protein, partial [Mycoplasmataceae bacterium]|nr:LicD family protein [Mycoplasmataceae bacterium]
MLSQKKELISFFKEFTELLEKEKLWYVAEAGTLLGAIREGKMIEWDDDIDVLISIETYRYLKNKYPKNFLDMDTKGYPFIIA